MDNNETWNVSILFMCKCTIYLSKAVPNRRVNAFIPKTFFLFFFFLLLFSFLYFFPDYDNPKASIYPDKSAPVCKVNAGSQKTSKRQLQSVTEKHYLFNKCDVPPYLTDVAFLVGNTTLQATNWRQTGHFIKFIWCKMNIGMDFKKS